jgi:hypothetical protein
MLSACERCGERLATAELEFDTAGKSCCRRCRAHIAVARADHSLIQQGVVRTCRRCGQRTLRPEVETYTVPSGVTNEREARSAFGFHYRCSSCSARAWFFRPGVLAFFVAAWLVTLPVVLIVEPTMPFGWRKRGMLRLAFSTGDVPLWVRWLLVLIIPVALLGYDQWQRHRNPPAT